VHTRCAGEGAGGGKFFAAACSFSADAKREAIRDGVPPIELVDGEKLVDLFEKLELGLSPRTTYDLVPSFFDEFKD
jgi:restriction system protein